MFSVVGHVQKRFLAPDAVISYSRGVIFAAPSIPFLLTTCHICRIMPPSYAEFLDQSSVRKQLGASDMVGLLPSPGWRTRNGSKSNKVLPLLINLGHCG